MWCQLLSTGRERSEDLLDYGRRSGTPRRIGPHGTHGNHGPSGKSGTFGPLGPFGLPSLTVFTEVVET